MLWALFSVFSLTETMSRSVRTPAVNSAVRTPRTLASRNELPASARPASARQEEMELSLAMATLTDDKLVSACQSNEVLANFCEESDILSERTASIAASRKSFAPVSEEEIGDWTINQITAYFASLDDDHSSKFLANPIARAVVLANPLTAIRAHKLEEPAKSVKSVRSPRSVMKTPLKSRRGSASPSRVALEDIDLWNEPRVDAKTLSAYNPMEVAALAEVDPVVAKAVATPEYRSLTRRSPASMQPTAELCAKCQGYLPSSAAAAPATMSNTSTPGLGVGVLGTAALASTSMRGATPMTSMRGSATPPTGSMSASKGSVRTPAQSPSWRDRTAAVSSNKSVTWTQ